MNKAEAKALLTRYAEGQCSPEEAARVATWYHRVAGQQADPVTDADYALLYVQAYERLQQALTRSQQQEKPKRLLRWLPYAAAVMLVATLVGYFAVISQKSSVDSLAATEILPGGNKATLTLADGRTIDLSEAQAGIVVGDGITYVDGSQVLDDAEGSPQTALTTYDLQLTTPKGGTYQITLPDGSKVWLNANSTLRYPSRFPEDERVVQLEGEAFFEIKAQRIKEQGHAKTALGAQTPKGSPQVPLRPFKVLTAGQEVEVLGTEFNVSAYSDDPETKTTLVNGLVAIANLTSNAVNRLNPGEQSTMRGATTAITKVDVSVFTAWKDGFFYFDRLPTQAAIAQLARWYDLDVVYEGKLADVNMFAYIERDKPLSALLKSLEKSGLKFRVMQSGERKQLIVLGE